MKTLLDFDDPGAQEDHPARGVTVGDIRAWYDAVERILIGGNHIAAHRTDNWPAVGTAHDTALEALGAGKDYDMWCCWNAMMQSRDVLVWKGPPMTGPENNVPDYTKMRDVDLLDALGDDASRWAAAFCQIAKTHGHDIDEGWMIGWFANAIEHSWYERTNRALPTTTPINFEDFPDHP